PSNRNADEIRLKLKPREIAGSISARKKAKPTTKGPRDVRSLSIVETNEISVCSHHLEDGPASFDVGNVPEGRDLEAKLMRTHEDARVRRREHTPIDIATHIADRTGAAAGHRASDHREAEKEACSGGLERDPWFRDVIGRHALLCRASQALVAVCI